MFIQDDSRRFRAIRAIVISVIIGIILLYALIFAFIFGLKITGQGPNRLSNSGGVAYVGDYLIVYGPTCGENMIGFYMDYMQEDSMDYYPEDVPIDLDIPLLRDVVPGTDLDPESSLDEAQGGVLGYGISPIESGAKNGWVVIGVSEFETTDWFVDLDSDPIVPITGFTIVSGGDSYTEESSMTIDNIENIPKYDRNVDLENIELYSYGEMRTASEWWEWTGPCNEEFVQFHSIEDLLAME